jgi:N-acetylneuraminic acid mutarotase
MPGGPRQETSVVALGGEIYALGGFNASAQVVSTVEAYDPGSNTWRARADLPFALHHMNAAVVGDRIFVVGALTGLGFVQNPNILEYDAQMDAWNGAGEMPAGTDRGSAGVCALGTKIYLAGGYRAGAALTMFSAYDTEAGSFESLPDLPNPLDHLAAVCVNGVVYVIGGRNRSIEATTAAVWAFDPTVGDWAERAPMPRPRGGFAGAAALEGRIYVFGGEGNGDPGSRGVFADADVYDPASDRWFMVTAMITPRHGTAAAALGSHIYVPGGATQQAFGAVDVNEAFSPTGP